MHRFGLPTSGGFTCHWSESFLSFSPPFGSLICPLGVFFFEGWFGYEKGYRCCFCFARTRPISLFGDLAWSGDLPRPIPRKYSLNFKGGGRTSSPFLGVHAFFPATIAYPVSFGPFSYLPIADSDQCFCFNKYKSTHLNVELLHPCDRLVDGVVVALVGDVVPSSRPCWLHITREGLLDRAATLVLLKSRTHSSVGLCLSHARKFPLDPCPLGLKMGCS